jgi:branched-chain amino acid transport system ATP-binding protein
MLIVALLGSNGAGKTTTLKTIMRLLYDQKKEQPEKGTIEFLGTRIDRMDTDKIVKMGISYVPEGREVFPELSVMENILMGAYTRRDKKEIQQDMERIFLNFPILKERKDQEAGYLSGGEQQMLAIGRALMSRPKLLMLDEPSLGMSPLLTKEIFNIIRDINQKEKVTILLVEQNVNMALNYSHYAYLMENGRIVRADKPEVLREDEDVKEFYLGIATETSVKGYKRYRRKVRFR